MNVPCDHDWVWGVYFDPPGLRGDMKHIVACRECGEVKPDDLLLPTRADAERADRLREACDL